MSEETQTPPSRRGRLLWTLLGAMVIVGLVLTLFVYRSDWLRPVLEPLSGPATAGRPYPLRRFDPTCRLRGWQALGANVDAVCAMTADPNTVNPRGTGFSTWRPCRSRNLL